MIPRFSPSALENARKLEDFSWVVEDSDSTESSTEISSISEQLPLQSPLPMPIKIDIDEEKSSQILNKNEKDNSWITLIDNTGKKKAAKK